LHDRRRRRGRHGCHARGPARPAAPQRRLADLAAAESRGFPPKVQRVSELDFRRLSGALAYAARPADTGDEAGGDPLGQGAEPVVPGHGHLVAVAVDHAYDRAGDVLRLPDEGMHPAWMHGVLREALRLDEPG